MSENTRLEVQATLLNSGQDPKVEIADALESVAEFAYAESELSLEEFAKLAHEAWQRGVARVID